MADSYNYDSLPSYQADHDAPDVVFDRPQNLSIAAGTFDLAQFQAISGKFDKHSKFPPDPTGAEGISRRKVMVNNAAGVVITGGAFTAARNIYRFEESVHEDINLSSSLQVSRAPPASHAPFAAAGVDSAMIAALPAEKLAMIPAAAFATCPVELLESIPLSTRAALPPHILAEYPSSALIDLPPDILANLPISKIASLPLNVVQTLPPRVLERILKPPSESLPRARPQILSKLALMVCLVAILYTTGHLVSWLWYKVCSLI